jgi:hypothetical protein
MSVSLQNAAAKNCKLNDHKLEKCGGKGPYITKHVDIVFNRNKNRKKSLTPIKADLEQNVT